MGVGFKALTDCPLRMIFLRAPYIAFKTGNRWRRIRMRNTKKTNNLFKQERLAPPTLYGIKIIGF